MHVAILLNVPKKLEIIIYSLMFYNSYSSVPQRIRGKLSLLTLNPKELRELAFKKCLSNLKGKSNYCTVHQLFYTNKF